MELNQYFGVALICLGLLTLAARFFGWNRLFWKRDRMMKTYGQTAGAEIHFFSYTIVPLLAGIFFIYNP
ncbi:hypothetical protein C8N35_102515 [Breoghania corrubedonensis]|uniref:Uncharacterized protein n=1 Tax=Breoghania corrubedonensis TaxID=665038 RepID=A0A2T5VDF5_9HYPH|nr:hypothetical protein [Breoghania corrubedonensis]PTW61799.1 hypothetical protein C8N35_102515 [Breoghania corrubedonensis]